MKSILYFIIIIVNMPLLLKTFYSIKQQQLAILLSSD